MKRKFPAVLGCSLAIVALLGSGCAITDLKNTNRRLKEANDRLVAENNRLEQELAASEKDAAEKAKKIDELQGEMERGKSAPVAIAEPKERATPDLSQFDEEGITEIRTPQGILLRLEDKVFFAQGKAALSTKGQTILRNVAAKLNGRYRVNMIRVEGHTDDVPVNKVKNQYPSNWELSTARACAVVRYLVDRGRLSPTRIYPAGFAYYKPISPSKTPAARSKNRRVEILILNQRV